MRHSAAPEGVRPFVDARLRIERRPPSAPGGQLLGFGDRFIAHAAGEVARDPGSVVGSLDLVDAGVELALGLLINACHVAQQNHGEDGRAVVARRVGEALAVLRLPGSDDLQAFGSER